MLLKTKSQSLERFTSSSISWATCDAGSPSRMTPTS
jgi:hypothetical protein